MNPRARAFWAQARLHVWPQRYQLIRFDPDRLSEAAGLAARSAGRFAALVLERDEVSLTVEEEVWRAGGLEPRARATSGPWRAITLDVDVDLDVCGFLAPAAERLAEAGVSIVPQCATLKDHLLVREQDLERTLEVLGEIIRGCRVSSRRAPPRVRTRAPAARRR